ncbi:hypothetical protein Tco_1076249 [Tanacetum coccineum]
MLTNNGWVDGNGSNVGGGFKKPGGGQVTRGGGDGLEGLVGVRDSLGDDDEVKCVLLLDMDFDGACGGEMDFFLRGEDVIVKASQKHGKWHGTILFVFYFLHSINKHRSEVELSFDSQIVKHVCSTCIYFISLAKGAKEIFPKEKFPSSQLGMNFVKMEFVGVSLKLSLSGSRSSDGLFDEIMFRPEEITIGMIIKIV